MGGRVERSKGKECGSVIDRVKDILVLSSIVLLLTACGEKNAEDSAASGTFDGIEQAHERGPLRVVARVSPKEPTVADVVELELEVTAAENYTISYPEVGDKLDEFDIRDWTETQPKLVEDNQMRRVRTYYLEPFLSGDYQIPSLKFMY